MFEFFINLITSLGLPGITLAMFVEAAGFPIPSEMVLGFTGYMVYRGTFDLWVAVFMAAIGNVMGSTVIYAAGRFIGYPFIDKYGKWFGVESDDVAKATKWFEKFGQVTIMVAQVIPMVRTVVSFPAGLLKVRFINFICFTFIGTFVWSAILINLGLAFGPNWEKLGDMLNSVQNVVLALSLVVIVYFARRWYIRRRK